MRWFIYYSPVSEKIVAVNPRNNIVDVDVAFIEADLLVSFSYDKEIFYDLYIKNGGYRCIGEL